MPQLLGLVSVPDHLNPYHHMQRFKLFLLASMVLFSTMAFVSPSNPPKKMLRHVVLFKFKDSATPAQVKEVEDAFRKLPSKIKGSERI
jgi:hypothetical protein